jgi:hypothetical protein
MRPRFLSQARYAALALTLLARVGEGQDVQTCPGPAVEFSPRAGCNVLHMWPGTGPTGMEGYCGCPSGGLFARICQNGGVGYTSATQSCHAGQCVDYFSETPCFGGIERSGALCPLGGPNQPPACSARQLMRL